MREIHVANMTVTTFQLVAVAIACSFFGAGLAGASLTAAITAGVSAAAMAYGTWEKPADNHKHAIIGLIALSAAVAAFGLWLWSHGKEVLAVGALAVVCLLTHLLARKAQHWSKRPYATLVVTALPNVGVVLGATVGVFILIREAAEEVF